MSSNKNGGGQSDRPANRKPAGHTAPGTVSGKKPPRPSQCRNYTRDAIAESMPVIVDSFVSEAKKGSVPHFNLLTKIGGFDHRPAAPPSKRKGKSFAHRLLDDMKQHEAKLIDTRKRRGAAEPGTAK